MSFLTNVLDKLARKLETKNYAAEKYSGRLYVCEQKIVFDCDMLTMMSMITISSKKRLTNDVWCHSVKELTYRDTTLINC